MKPNTTRTPGAFEVARPADIRLFIETRFQFDQRRYRLSGFAASASALMIG